MTSQLQSIPWARRLKLRHLEVFLSLHQTGSLTAAAAQLHMTQPAMSHWLTDLEGVVGCSLFVRNRRFALTAAGDVFRLHAERMVGDVQRTHRDLEAVQAGHQGALYVGTTLPAVLLPKAITRLQEGRQGVFVSVVESSLSDLLDRMARCEVDIVIGALSAVTGRTAYASEVLINDSMQVVARRGHPILRKRKPSWSDTLLYPWILPPGSTLMRNVLDEAFAAQHLQPPRPCVESTSSMRLQLLAEDRDYLSILLTSEMKQYQPRGLVQVVRMEPSIPFPDIGAIWDADRAGPLLTRLLEALRMEAAAK